MTTRFNQHIFFTAEEVGKFWRVGPKTVGRWADKGKITCVRTPGGHKRYPKKEVLAQLVDAGVLTIEEAEQFIGEPRRSESQFEIFPSPQK